MLDTEKSVLRSNDQSLEKRSLSGLLLFPAVTLLAAGIFWFWLTTISPSVAQSAAGDDMSIGEIAIVDAIDIPSAIKTMDGLPAFLQRFQPSKDHCAVPLAWVSLVAAQGAVPSKVRLRSGGYLSPVFSIKDAPVRVAIPYPAAYEVGRGQLLALGTGGNLEIGLKPPWKVELGQSNSNLHNVSWQPINRCVGANG